MPDTKESRSDARSARLAEALRVNLKRRKLQARERADVGADAASHEPAAAVTNETQGGNDRPA